MFDLGFWELITIMIVALLVIGPERLPGVARKAGMWVGRARRFVRTVKDDIDRELAADELRRVLKEQSDSSGVHEIIEETKSTVNETRDALNEPKKTFEQTTGKDYLVGAVQDSDSGSQSSTESESESRKSLPSNTDEQQKQEH